MTKELYRLTYEHECFVRHSDLFQVSKAKKLGEKILVRTSQEDSFGLESFNLAAVRPTMKINSILTEKVSDSDNIDCLIVGLNFKDKQSQESKSQCIFLLLTVV